jgi:ABC-type multidrug transport system fused ATPase/permease subunit
MWLQRVLKFGFTFKNIFAIISLSLISTLTEIFGIGIFLPVFQYIRENGNVNALAQDSVLWEYLIRFFDFIRLDVSLLYLLIAAFLFFGVKQIFLFIRMVYLGALTHRVTKAQRDKMFNRYLDADTTYHDKMPVGNLVNAMTTELNSAMAGILAPLDLIVGLIMMISYMVFLSFLSWEMTLASLVILLVASRLPKAWIRKSAQVGRFLAESNTKMSSFLVERIKSPRLVRLAGTTYAEKKDFFNLTRSQQKHSVSGIILSSKTDVVIEPVVIALSLTFLYVAYTYIQMSIEEIGLYLLIVLRLMPVAKISLMRWQKMQAFLGSIEIVLNRLNAMQEAKEVDRGNRKLDHFKNSIELKNVSFQYANADESAIKNISISFPKGQMVALVGASGSGKSTLIDLLPALRIPSSGGISIDGIELSQYSLAAIRSAIAYAPQSPQIFDGTVENHIRYGKPDASEEEIQQAAKLAGAEEFINNLPNGYHTHLGEDAVNLSGGQRQRLDLARALVRNAAILILDEPTSNLDAESEDKFKQALIRIRKETETSIIIVAHRLAGIADADNIIVLDKGSVESQGTHRELQNIDGWYAKAWKMQEQVEV